MINEVQALNGSVSATQTLNGNVYASQTLTGELETRGSASKCIEVSTKEPTNKDIILWYEISPDVDLNEFYLEYEGNNLIMNYQDDLSLDFNVVDNELVVTNDVSELDFNINENKELEVKYGN